MADLLADLGKNSKTGTLEIKVGSTIKLVFFKNGYITFAASTDNDEDLGKYLLKKGKITSDEFDQISYLTKKKNQKIGKILIDRGYLKPDELFQFAQQHIEDIITGFISKKDGGYEFKEGSLPLDQPITVQINVSDIINRANTKIKDAAAKAPQVEKILDETSSLEQAGDAEAPHAGKPDSIGTTDDIISAAHGPALDEDNSSQVLDIGAGTGEASKEETSSPPSDLPAAGSHSRIEIPEDIVSAAQGPALDEDNSSQVLDIRAGTGEASKEETSSPPSDLPAAGSHSRIEIPEDIVSAAQGPALDEDNSSQVLDISAGPGEVSKEGRSSGFSGFPGAAPSMEQAGDAESPSADVNDHIKMPEDIASAAQGPALDEDNSSQVLDIGAGPGEVSKEETSSSLSDFLDTTNYMEPSGDTQQTQAPIPDRFDLPEETNPDSHIPALKDDILSPGLDIGSGPGEDSKEDLSSGLSGFPDAASSMEQTGDAESPSADVNDHVEMPEDIASASVKDIAHTQDRDGAIEQEPVSTNDKVIGETTDDVELDTVSAFADKVFTSKKTLLKRLRLYAVVMIFFALLLGAIAPFAYDIENIKFADIEARLKNIKLSDIERTFEIIKINDIKSTTQKIKNKIKSFSPFSSAPAETQTIPLPSFRDKALSKTMPGMSEKLIPLPYFHEEALRKLLSE